MNGPGLTLIAADPYVQRPKVVPMRGNEERVIQAFCAFLDEQEWVTEREIGFVDAVAQKDGQRTFAEAKGRTVAIGLDEDTMFGQLPRRMRDECPGPDTRFAVVVPTHASAAAEGVPAGFRRELSIDLYVVGHDWSVSKRA